MMILEFAIHRYSDVPVDIFSCIPQETVTVAGGQHVIDSRDLFLSCALLQGPLWSFCKVRCIQVEF